MHIDHSSSFSPLSSSPSQVFVPTDVLAAQEVIENFEAAKRQRTLDLRRFWGDFFWSGRKQNPNSAAWIWKCPGVRCPNVYCVLRTGNTFEEMIYPHNLIHHLRRSPADENRFWKSNQDSDHCDFDKYYILAILDTKDKSESWRYRLWKFVLML